MHFEPLIAGATSQEFDVTRIRQLSPPLAPIANPALSFPYILLHASFGLGRSKVLTSSDLSLPRVNDVEPKAPGFIRVVTQNRSSSKSCQRFMFSTFAWQLLFGYLFWGLFTLDHLDLLPWPLRPQQSPRWDPVDPNEAWGLAAGRFLIQLDEKLG